MRTFFSYGVLLTAIAAGVVVACGDNPQPKTPDQAASSMPSATPPASASAIASATPSAIPSASAAPSASASTATPPAAITMTPIQKSTLVDKLKDAGLDPKHLPKLSKVERSKISKVMNTFTAALGYKCMDCHTDDFKAWTPKKHIAEHMWDEFAVALSMDDGSPLYCDSCHQGKAKLLDRRDKKALSGFMQDNFVAKLKRVDKKDHGCETCHGDPFEGDILKNWTK